MNKRIIQPFFIGCVLCATATAFILKNEPAAISPLCLENINALTAGEEGGTIVCYGNGSIICPTSNKKVGGYYVFYSD